MKKKIALHGSYFKDNFGDSLFVEIFCNWCKEIDSSIEIFLPYAGERVRDRVKHNPLKGIKAISNADGMVFIGGGYLGAPNKFSWIWYIRMLIRYVSIALINKILKKPYIFIGVGAGPLELKYVQKLVAYVCNNADKVVVRDKQSYEYLISYGVNSDKLLVTTDSALDITQDSVNKDRYLRIKQQLKNSLNPETTKVIGLHLAMNDPKVIDIICDSMNEILRKYKDLGAVLFLDYYKDGYTQQILNQLKDKLNGNITIYHYTSPQDMIALLNNLDVIITSKLHCGIVSSALNKPVLAIPYHNKIERFYKQIQQVESVIFPSEITKDKFKQSLINKLENETTTKIPNEIIELVFQNKKYLKKFIYNE